MKLKEIMAYMDDASAPADGESIDQIGMRCSRIRILAACATNDPDRHAAGLYAETAVEKLRGVVRRRIHDELRAILRTEVTL